MKEKNLLISIIVFVFLLSANLVFLDWRWLKQTKGELPIKKENNSELAPTPILISPTPANTSDSCGSVCQQVIEEKISQAVATLSAKENKTPEKITPSKVTTQPQTIYIPLGGGGSTANTTWTDVGNAEVYFDLNDYPNLVEARFEGFIRVKNGNGKAFARLYDVTHSIGVQGSDIESDSENFTLVISSPLSFWQGKNLYRIQLKSLNGYDAYLDSGRIKLILK